jgi:uncharacterized protein YqjF (DUF2071 family)
MNWQSEIGAKTVVSRQTFLTASWKNLCMITYHVPDELLIHRLPPGFELDLFHGQACVSFVAFDFIDTKVFGVSWPGYTNFSGVNLFFYVRGYGKRGVGFIQKLVPKKLVAAIARFAYNEPYEALAMGSHTEETADGIHISHWLSKDAKTHRLDWLCESSCRLPSESSTEQFFKEHQWGFGRDRKGRTLEYEVQHPSWQVRDIRSARENIDFGQLYGQEWSFLGDAEPISRICAVGSEIKVFKPSAHPSAAVGMEEKLTLSTSQAYSTPKEMTCIVIVDDDPFIIEAWVTTPKASEVYKFTKPEDALSWFQNNKGVAAAVFFITDYVFENSRLTGVDLVRSLPQKPEWTVLYSDYDVTEEERSAFDLIVSKQPISVEEIFERIVGSKSKNPQSST